MKVKVKVIPNSNQSKFDCFMDDGTLKIRLKAPPVDGKANEELIRFLAQVLLCRKDEIKIIHGHSSRIKLLLIPSELEKIWNERTGSEE